MATLRDAFTSRLADLVKQREAIEARMDEVQQWIAVIQTVEEAAPPNAGRGRQKRAQ